MNASKLMPEEDVEETVTKNKLALVSLAERFQFFKAAVDFFYDMYPFMIWTLKLKQMVGELLP